MRTSGIYKIENAANGRFYIGSSVDMALRWNQHRSALDRGCHKNPKLQNAWNKYGPDCLTMRPLLRCDELYLLFFEQRCLDSFNAVVDGYNLSPVAGNTLGRKLSSDACANISAAKKGIKKSPEARAAHAAAMARPDVRARISASKRGKSKRPVSDSHRKALSRSQMGKVLSEETKAKLSAANIGKKRGPHSEETRRRISESQKGRPLKPEHVQALIAARAKRKA